MKFSSRQILIFGVICFSGFIIDLIAFYPGFLSPDSLEQYMQARAGVYSDWHPPAMAYFWRQLNKIYEGPGLMLAFQLACLWTAVYYLLTSINKRVWQVLCILFALMPFVQNFAGYVIKDTQMAGCWILAFAISFRPLINDKRLRWTEAIISLLLLLYGTWIRPNALPGLLPLAIFWIYSVMPSRKWPAKWGLGIALTILIAVGQTTFTKILKPQHNYPESKLFMHDLTGIYAKTGENVFPPVLYESPEFDTSYLRMHYHPATFDDIWWNNDGVIALPSNSERVATELKSAWLKAIKKHPGVYLKNRAIGSLYFLRLKNRKDNFMYRFRWMQPNDLGLVFEGNALTNIVFTPIEAQEHMPYMRPWFWFVLNLALCGCVFFVRNHKYKLSIAAVSYSSLFYLLPFFLVFQTDTDFRYFYWNCFACTIALFLYLAYYLKWNKPHAGA